MPQPPSILRDENAVRIAITQSASAKDVLQFLGLRAAGGNYATFRDACARFGIAPPFPGAGRNPPLHSTALADDVVFREDSTYRNSAGLKRRLIASGVPEVCVICGIGPEWNGRPLTLQVDHINGVHNDNRRENLRLLCPNCHSQTETFAGRRSRVMRAPITQRTCPRCRISVRPRTRKCPKCRGWLTAPSKGRPEKIRWPADAVLAAMVTKGSFLAAGRALGVSDNAVRKRLRNRGLLPQ